MSPEKKLDLLVQALQIIGRGSTDLLTRRYCVSILIEAGEKDKALEIAREAYTEPKEENGPENN
jgi:hypothetical protein